MVGILISFFAGIIFAVGLVISGMTNPSKVIGFLDIFGNWDYSLLFVMGGAVVTNFFTFKYLTKRAPLCAPKHFLPEKKELDKSLIIGPIVFGIGWGITGICPGPGLVNLVTMKFSAFLFVASLILGMLLYKAYEMAKAKK